jgi:16S rRNA (uracil1498-N3)-methyltransferase
MAGRPATRLHVDGALARNAVVALTPGQVHKLRNVLRLASGAAVALFNGRDGEWLARIDELGKSRGSAVVETIRRPPSAEGDLWLVFAPIKRAPLDLLVEKATELGVSELVPLWTARSHVDRINRERLQANAVDAAEQCERLTVPLVRAPALLAVVLAAWPPDRRLILCDESGRAPPIAARLTGPPAGDRAGAGGAALLVGPEGGFTETELDALANLPFVTPVGLGPRVLRADTAAIAALAVFQAVAGDWRSARVRDPATLPPSSP